jgi:hypothetical protein
LGTVSSVKARVQVSSLASAVGRSARAVAARRTPVAGGVARLLGGDLGVPGRADGDQPVQEGPAGVGVDLQALHDARAVEQAAQHGGVLPGAGGAGEGARPLQLGVAARLRGLQRGQRLVRERPPAALGPARVGEVGQRDLHPAQQRLDDADLGLGVHPRQHQRHPVAGRQLGVPCHVPRRGPAQRARQRVGDGADGLLQGGQRPLVEPQLGVGQVVVVDQHQVRRGVAGELGDLGQLALDVQLDPGAPGQPLRPPVVEAHGQPVTAQHRVLGTAVCWIATRAYRPSSVSSRTGRNVLTWLVSATAAPTR